MSKSENIGQLVTALVAAQKEMPTVEKGSVNPFFHSKYADLADIVTVTLPVISKHGLAVTQLIGGGQERTTLTTMLMHESGEYLSSEMPLMLSKDDAQGQGSATTYARRYAYSAILGIVTEADDDGNAASQPRDHAASPASDAHPASDAQWKFLAKLQNRTIEECQSACGALSAAGASALIEELK